jgi:hypothetical protein
MPNVELISVYEKCLDFNELMDNRYQEWKKAEIQPSDESEWIYEMVIDSDWESQNCLVLMVSQR